MANETQLPIEIVSTAIERLTGERPAELSLACRSLRGGLTAPGIVVAAATYTDRHGRRRSLRLVMKHLAGRATREQAIYEQLVVRYAKDVSPGFMGVVEVSTDQSVLLLEAVRNVAWPWGDTRVSQRVLERLAAFHLSTRAAVATPVLSDWRYEEALEASAHETYETLLSCRSRPELSGLLKAAPATRRMVHSLRACREALFGLQPFGRCVLHGDVHPGNVLIRRGRRQGEPVPVLIDWERARAGSPLEDVSSWLQSLGFWEPEARRRHDTIFSAYLAAMGAAPRLTPEIRAAYWLAGASNALAGALRYHLAVAQGDADERERGLAARAAFSWLRVLRRADAVWS